MVKGKVIYQSEDYQDPSTSAREFDDLLILPKIRLCPSCLEGACVYTLSSYFQAKVLEYRVEAGWNWMEALGDASIVSGILGCDGWFEKIEEGEVSPAILDFIATSIAHCENPLEGTDRALEEWKEKGNKDDDN